MKITESQLRSIITKTIKESLQETPKFEKGWNDYEKRERRLANFVDDIYGDKPTPYDTFPEFANAIDAQMHNGRIAKHLANRGKKAMEESISKAIKESLGELREPSFGNNDRALSRAIDAHCNRGPSQEEEEFGDELYNLLDLNAHYFITHGWTINDFKKWCKEMIDDFTLSC